MTPMGTVSSFFTLLLSLSLSNLNTNFVTGTVSPPPELHQETGLNNDPMGNHVYLKNKEIQHEQSDLSDAQLPDGLNDFGNFQNLQNFPNFPNPRKIDIEPLNHNHLGYNKHILSKRQVRQYQTYQNNDYERFYLCLFTLFTNPQCRNQNYNQNNQNHNRNYFTGQNFQNQNFQNFQNYDPSAENSAFVPLFPELQQQPVQQIRQQQRPVGLLGLGLNIGQNLFRPFSPVSPTTNPNQFNYLDQNNYFNNLQKQKPKPEDSVVATVVPEPIPIVPIVPEQSPYPIEQQTLRRPGPPPPESIKKTDSTTTTKTTTLTTTTTKPTTTTQRPTTTPWTYTSTKRKPVWATLVTQVPLPQRNKVENFDKRVDKPVDCDNKTQIQSQTTSQPQPSRVFDCSSCPIQSKLLKLSQLQEENTGLKSQAEISLKQIQSSQIQIKYLQEALTTVQADNSKLKQRISLLERTNEDLQTQNGQLQHSSGDQRAQLNDLRQKVKYLEQKLVQFSRQGLDIERCGKQNAQLRSQMRELVLEKDECRNQLYQQKPGLKKEKGNSGEKMLPGFYDPFAMGKDSYNLLHKIGEGSEIEMTTLDGLDGEIVVEDINTTMNPEDISITLVQLQDDVEVETTTLPQDEPETKNSTVVSTTTTVAPISTTTTASTSTTQNPIQNLLNTDSELEIPADAFPSIIFDDEDSDPTDDEYSDHSFNVFGSPSQPFSMSNANSHHSNFLNQNPLNPYSHLQSHHTVSQNFQNDQNLQNPQNFWTYPFFPSQFSSVAASGPNQDFQNQRRHPGYYSSL